MLETIIDPKILKANLIVAKAPRAEVYRTILRIPRIVSKVEVTDPFEVKHWVNKNSSVIKQSYGTVKANSINVLLAGTEIANFRKICISTSG